MIKKQLIDSAQPAVNPRIASRANVHRIENQNLKACYKNMSTGRIVWQSVGFLSFRHRVGLLGFTSSAFGAYIIYDKFLHIFF